MTEYLPNNFATIDNVTNFDFSLIQPHNYKFKKTEENFFEFYSTAITNDIGFKLFREIYESNNISINPLDIQLQEFKGLRLIIEKLNVLNEVFGIFQGLTEEQIQTFEQSSKRRPFFG